ncbi:hypothetical protein MW887_003633 [Aspergillus wentii]|nr:hypothetical protein MW887_003633 [Aspergillus wentii]
MAPSFKPLQPQPPQPLPALRNNLTIRPLHQLHTASIPDHKDAAEARELFDLSLGFSRTRMSGNVEMHCTLYSAQHSTLPARTQKTKLDIARQYGLDARDLRTIDLPSEGLPQILIRESTMLINFFNLRLLVQADQVLLFHVNDTAGRREDITTHRVFAHDLEGKLRGDPGLGVSANLPYELRVLEAALASVTSTLEAEYVMAKKEVVDTLETLDKEESLVHSKLRSLLDLARTLAYIEQRATQVRSTLQDLLNTDEDMAEMYLSDKRAGKRHAIQDHQDVEYLLEAYYKASDGVVQSVGSLLGNIRRTEETTQSILDVRRNQIMVLEAKIEIIMLGLAAATLVAGLYGMNVVNYSEESEMAFGVLTLCCVVGTLGITRYGMRRLKHIQKVHL